MNLRTAARHLLTPAWRARRLVSPASLERITGLITESERSHDAELRFAIEGALDLPELVSGKTARARAIEVFSQLRVWDTEQNNGVLLYLLVAEHDIEIVADRGIAARVPESEWTAICHEMERELRAGNFEGGISHGIRRISTLLSAHFPKTAGDKNELPDQPVIL